jgi:uncharacterized RDD family membrane protein YckC
MARQLLIRTPENVDIAFTLAGLVTRGTALAVDGLIQAVVAAGIVWGIVRFGGDAATRAEITRREEWLGVLFLAAISILLWSGYYVLFETVWNGQTPGKRLAGIRVVKDDGRPVDFLTAVARNLLRMVDAQPLFLYAVGMASIFASSRYKRLGDYVAGTVVVKEYREPRRRGRLEAERSTPIEDDAPLPNVERMTRDDFEAAYRFISRRAELPPDTAAELAARIARPIREKLGSDLATASCPDDLFLELVCRAYLRRQDLRLL